MIDHTGVSCVNLEKSKAFYLKALAALRYEVVFEFATGDKPAAIGLGVNGKADFVLHEGPAPKPRMHVAFRASDRNAVEVFYKEALAAGGRDNGMPGPRPHYHADYYGAFVLDPDGNNIEVVYHGADSEATDLVQFGP